MPYFKINYMKTSIISLIVFSVITLSAKAQISAGGTRVIDNHALGSFTYSRLTQEKVLALSGRALENNQFFTKDWVNGIVVTVRNETFSSGLLFLYDKANNILYYKMKDSSSIMSVDSRNISSFTLNSDKAHKFKPGRFYSTEFGDKYVEVLTLSDSGYALIKAIKSTLPGEQISDVAVVTAQEPNTKYKDEISYYIYHNGVVYPVDLKKKSLVKNMTDDSTFISLLNEQNSDKITESSLALLINQLNL